MSIEHIIWTPSVYNGIQTGLLEIGIIYHGGGEDKIRVQGTYDHDTRTLTPAGGLHVHFGAGIADVYLVRVGRIPDQDPHP